MIARACSFTSGALRKAVQGRLTGSAATPIAGICTDTREALGGKLFVALRGERFDAHDFLAAAIEGGAAALLVERAAYQRRQHKLPKRPRCDVIVVQDSLRALGDLAAWHRRRVDVPVIALSGSNGKTTTKELIAALLSAKGEVLRTEGNLNNLIGAPMTLLGLAEGQAAAVVELGMNHPGELSRLTEIVQPDVGLLLNVGPAHLGNFADMDAIAKAKGELYAGLPTSAVAILNVDDPRVAGAAVEARVARQRSFGRAEHAQVCLLSASPEGAGQQLRLRVDGEEIELFLPLRGAHNALNLAAAVAAATALGPLSQAEMQAGLSTCSPGAGRGAWSKRGPYTVIDESYNANRASMLAAIKTTQAAAAQEGRPFGVLLGEMLELGARSEVEHRRVAAALARSDVRAVAGFGPQMAPLVEEAAAAGRPARHEPEDRAALLGWLKANLPEGALLLVKGSRGARMERFLEMLEGDEA